MHLDTGREASNENEMSPVEIIPVIKDSFQAQDDKAACNMDIAQHNPNQCSCLDDNMSTCDIHSHTVQDSTEVLSCNQHRYIDIE